MWVQYFVLSVFFVFIVIITPLMASDDPLDKVTLYHVIGVWSLSMGTSFALLLFVGIVLDMQ